MASLSDIRKSDRFVQTDEGNVEIFRDGERVSTVSGSQANRLLRRQRQQTQGNQGRASRRRAREQRDQGGSRRDEGLADSDAAQALLDVGEAPEREDIASRLRENAQASVDRIRSQFNEAIRQEREAGEIRGQRGRAINISSGLAGSDFATARAEGIEQETREIIQTKKRQRNAQINEILSGVPSKVDEEYQEQLQQFRQRAETALDVEAQFAERQRTRAVDSISAVAASGASFEDLQASDNYERLLEAFGGSEDAVKGTFLNSMPEEQKLGSTTVGNKFMTFFRDPVTGDQKSVEFELPTQIQENQEVERIFNNGQVAVKTQNVDEQGNVTESIDIVTPPGAETVQGDGGGGGGTIFTTADGTDLDLSRPDDIKTLNEDYGFGYSEIQAFMDENTSLNQGSIQSLLAEAGLTGPGESSIQLDRERLSTLYGIPDNEEKSGFLGGLGFGETNKEKLDNLMSTVERYRAVGYSDEEILNLIQE